jgi:thymidylate kinase
MRLAVIGSQGVGKSTLVEAFRHYWPMYEIPEKTFREFIKENDLTINEGGSLESQVAARDFLADRALTNAGKSKTIHDRTILDNLVYSSWMAEYGKLGDDESKVNEFMTTSMMLTRECMKFYDIIFWLPINPNIVMEEREGRSVDKVFQEEIDNIFYGVYEAYKKNSGLLFDKENQPAFIVLEGELEDKLKYIKEYLDTDGNLIETTNSVLGDLENVYDEALLRKQVGLE